jgi:hypothetical protein
MSSDHKPRVARCTLVLGILLAALATQVVERPLINEWLTKHGFARHYADELLGDLLKSNRKK